MADRVWSSGNWTVKAGSAREFVRRWTAFAEWSREECPGLRWARLVRDTADPNHFVSFGEWADADERDRWMHHPGFQQRLDACRELCDDFQGGAFEEVGAVEAGARPVAEAGPPVH